jgi:hypothetical protein
MRVGGLRAGGREIAAARSGPMSYPPSVIPHGCLVLLRAHRTADACAAHRATGVPHPLRDLACGVVGGQTAALSVEGIVLGSAAVVTVKSWGRSARSGTARMDGRGA